MGIQRQTGPSRNIVQRGFSAMNRGRNPRTGPVQPVSRIRDRPVRQSQMGARGPTRQPRATQQPTGRVIQGVDRSPPQPVPQRVSDPGGQMQPQGPSPVRPQPQPPGLLANAVQGQGQGQRQAPAVQQNPLIGLFSALRGGGGFAGGGGGQSQQRGGGGGGGKSSFGNSLGARGGSPFGKGK